MITTFTALQIGQFHTNHCEDSFIVEPISKNRLLIGVMDGCTMGKESVFASLLLTKLLRKIARDFFYQDFLKSQISELDSQLKSVLHELFLELIHVKNKLGLDTQELLSTLLLGIVDSESFKSEIIIIGDGLICIDGHFHEFDQGDKPDYMAYHLGRSFELWYEQQNQRLSIAQFKDISLTTDGIFTFKHLRNSDSIDYLSKAMDYLLIDREFIGQKTCLERKMRVIANSWHLAPTDDLAIVRVINNSRDR